MDGHINVFHSFLGTIKIFDNKTNEKPFKSEVERQKASMVQVDQGSPTQIDRRATFKLRNAGRSLIEKEILRAINNFKGFQIMLNLSKKYNLLSF